MHPALHHPPSPALPVSAGAAPRLYFLCGALVGIPLPLVLVATLENISVSSSLLIAGTVAAVIFAWLGALRLEITAEGIRYRTLLGGTRLVGYAEIDRAAFEAAAAARNPRSARFRITARGHKPFTLSIRAFPRHALGAMFAQFARHGIMIEVPPSWHARFLARRSGKTDEA